MPIGVQGSRRATPLRANWLDGVLPGLVLGNRLLQVLKPELHLLRTQLLGATTKLVARQPLDQQAKFVVLGVQLAQHLPQQGRVVRQGVRGDLHGAMVKDAAASGPGFVCGLNKISPGECGPPRCALRPPLAAVEQGRQLRRGQHDPPRRGRRGPRELAPLQALGQHAQPDAVMPDQLDQSRAAATEGEHRTAERVFGQVLLHQHRQGGITKAGNSSARKALVEAAWTYRHSAGVGVAHQQRQAGLPLQVREIAWKAQTRLCARYRRLMAKGKRNTVVVIAIAREIAAFLWAIARHIAPLPPMAEVV